MMNTIKRAYARATASILAVLTLVVGVTFAAVNTQATLLGSSLSTTSVDLLLWNGTAYANNAPGFTVDNIVPGVGSQEFPVSFKNTGGSSLTIGAHITSTLKFSGFNSTSATTAMKGVKVTIKNSYTGEKIDTTLYALTLSTDVVLPGATIKGAVAGDPGIANDEGNYTLKFDVDPTYIGSTKAVVESFDLVFSGKPVTAV